MKRLSILTIIFAVMLGFTSCGQDTAKKVTTSSSYFNNQWTGNDPLFGQNQYYNLDQKYDVLKAAVLAKSVSQGLEPYDFFEHEEGTYSTTYFNFGSVTMRKKAVDTVASTSVNYTEFTGSPIINPNTATASVFDETDRQAIVDEVFSRSHTKVLSNIETVTITVNGRTYPGYKVIYVEQDPISNYYYTNKVSTYVICLAIPLMANPILVQEMVSGGKYKLLKTANYNQNL